MKLGSISITHDEWVQLIHEAYAAEAARVARLAAEDRAARKEQGY